MKWRLVAYAVVLMSLTLFAQCESSAVQQCSVPHWITYYSDSSHTTVVGQCGYAVCRDYTLGSWTCTGVKTAYSVESFFSCPCFVP
jgi:hypothetical protein